MPYLHRPIFKWMVFAGVVLTAFIVPFQAMSEVNGRRGSISIDSASFKGAERIRVGQLQREVVSLLGVKLKSKSIGGYLVANHFQGDSWVGLLIEKRTDRLVAFTVSLKQDLSGSDKERLGLSAARKLDEASLGLVEYMMPGLFVRSNVNIGYCHLIQVVIEKKHEPTVPGRLGQPVVMVADIEWINRSMAAVGAPVSSQRVCVDSRQ